MVEQQIAETAVADEPEPDDDGRERDDHLADVDDGCGCTEVWEQLSENRADD